MKEFFKFIFRDEVVYAAYEENDGTITLSSPTSHGLEYIIDEFFVNPVIFPKVLKLLRKLEERDSSLSEMREMVREFISREESRLALQSLCQSL